MEKQKITVSTDIHAGIDKVWESFNEPAHVTKWNAASGDWHCPEASNDLKTGGKFSYTMASKDGKMSFDFWGTYDEIIPHEKIAYTLGDGRRVEVLFEEKNGVTSVVETFDPENQNPLDMQRAGWQAIMDNFKKHTESI